MLDNDQLIKSKKIPSVLPTIGKKYFLKDLSEKADSILELRRKSILETSVMEAERSLSEHKNSLKLQIKRVPVQKKDIILELVKEAQERTKKLFFF